MKNKTTNNGFTLIELLVVIAIMGLLMSVVLTSLRSVRVKARDTRRIADLQQIKNALYLYAADNGNFPITSGWVFSNAGCGWISQLNPYIRCVPQDPLNTRGGATNYYGPYAGSPNFVYAYLYEPSTGSTDYDLVALLEDPENKNRCQTHPWIIHNYSNGDINQPAGSPWCPLWSNSLYADH